MFKTDHASHWDDLGNKTCKKNFILNHWLTINQSWFTLIWIIQFVIISYNSYNDLDVLFFKFVGIAKC